MVVGKYIQINFRFAFIVNTYSLIGVESEILYAVDMYSCVVVVAETGSGKTTCTKNDILSL